jgi:prepilin-type N-terminal cleavage/methylation domain-containing protein
MTSRQRKIPSFDSLPRHASAGFTLIEIIIVISLIAFVYSVAMPNLGLTSSSEIATKLGRLNSDVRAAYDLSVLSGKPYRLVFQLRSGDYWLESTDALDVKLGDDKVETDPSEEEVKNKEEEFESKFQEYVNMLGDAVTDPNSSHKVPQSSPVIQAKDILRGPVWAKVETLEWQTRSLGEGLIIKDMQAEHHRRKISLEEDGPEARAFIFFFPTGYVERAVIHIYYTRDEGVIDEEKEPYTFQTKPWEGVSVIDNGYTEVAIDEKD